MSNLTTAWILTAAMALFAGGALPVSRSQNSPEKKRILWHEETRSEERARIAHRLKDQPAAGDEVFVQEARAGSPQAHFAPLDNRPPPIALL